MQTNILDEVQFLDRKFWLPEKLINASNSGFLNTTPMGIHITHSATHCNKYSTVTYVITINSKVVIIS